MRRPVLTQRLALAAGLALVGSCSSGGSDGGGTGPTAAIALSLSSNSGTIVQGGAQPVGATLTRSGGYTGTVSFTVEGAPLGVSGSVGNVQTSGSTTTATVTIQTAASTPAGTTTLTIRATGSGVDSRTQSFQLTVTEAPDFTLAVTPNAATVVQGQNSAAIPVAIDRINFPGAVTLSLGGTVPSGVTAAFAPPAPTSNSASMTVTVGAAVVPGVYPLQVSGSGTPGTRNAAFALTVTPSGSVVLSLAPTGAVTLAQGASDNSITVNLARTNYGLPLTLTAENLPAGVSASFAGNPVSGNNSVMTLTATAGAAIGGPVTVTIRGTGPASLRVPDGAANLEATTTLTLTVKAPGSFVLAVTPPGTLTVFQGAGDNSRTVSITRSSYPAPVTLTAENLPAGLSASFAGNPVAGNSSVLTLTATPAAVPGNYTITIRGAGPAALKAPGGTPSVEGTTTLAVTIATLGSFTMNVTPVCAAGMTLSQGELDDSRIINLTRTNYPVGIQLSAEGLPAGVTASFASTPTTGNTARLTLTASASATVGNYSVTIRASGPSGPDATTALPLSVAAATTSPNSLFYGFDNDLEGWLPGGTCSTVGGADWGNAFQNNGYGGEAQFDGVGNIGEPNAWISKTLNLPATASALQFDVAAFIFAGADARLRVRIFDGPTATVLFDQVIVGGVNPPVFVTKTVDVRPWAGKTVRIFFEQDANGTAHEQILLDNVRIASALPSAWLYRRQLTVTTTTAAAPAGYSMSLQFDHAALVAAGKSLPNGDDVRIVYSDGTLSYELDRRRERGSQWNSATTRIWFPTQAAIGAGQGDGQYWLYYGNATAGTPPADRLRVFLFEDDFEGGSLSRWSVSANGLWAADNTRAHEGTFAVKYPPEADKASTLLPNLTINQADVYVESWWYLDSPSTGYKISEQVRQRTDQQSFYQGNLYQDGTGWGVGQFINPTFSQVSTTPGVAPVGSWFRVGTGISGTTLRVFVNGTQVAMATGLTALGAASVGLGKFTIPPGTAWWADDFVARRYVFPEPGSALGSEQSGPFPASLLGLQRPERR